LNHAVSQSITRKSASNLALAFVLLPRPKRAAMAALYAFCREVDDVADDEAPPLEARRAQLAAWRHDVAAACNGGQPRFAVNLELQPVIQHYRLPFEHFDQLIRGVEMDLDIKRYATLADLEQYCYRVASVVGLLSIEIFGYRNPACRPYAIHLGRALQLTNILRDVQTDAERGRIYLPLDQMHTCGVRPEDVLAGRYSEPYRQLATWLAEQARSHYRAARATLPAEDRPAMIAAELMGAVYWQLLRRLEARQFDVFHGPPLRLSRLRKLALILSTWARLRAGVATPSYGCP